MKRTAIIILLFGTMVSALFAELLIPGGTDLDLVLKNGTVVDGSGEAPRQADVAIRNGRIVAVGDLGTFNAKRTVDVKGQVIVPGFVDLLCHNDLLWSKEEQLKALRQGVTTGLVGNCGFSVIFVKENLKKVEGVKPLLNLATLIAHGTIRDRIVKQRRKTLAAPSEMKAMKELLERALQEGSFGLSAGLGYEPGEWTDPSELNDLASVLAKYPGSAYYTHIRNFRSEVLTAIREAVATARQTHVPVVLQHLLFKLPSNWEQVHEGLKILADARTEGLDVYATVYAYDFWGNEVQIPLAQMLYLKPEMLKGNYYNDPSRFDGVLQAIAKRLKEYGGGDRIEVTCLDPNMPSDYLGRSLSELARLRGLSNEEAVLALLIENRRAVKVCYHGLSGEALTEQIKTPYVLFGSDSSKDIPHPRNVGAYPRLFGTYVRERQVISLQEAVRKCSAEPAKVMGLKDRGSVKEGYWADLVIFDPEVIADEASPVSPKVPPKGIRMVVVNGQVAIEMNQLTGLTPGAVLRRGLP